MLLRSLLIWLGIMPLAILNGALREYILTPALGEKISLPISGVILMVCVYVMAFIFIPRLKRGVPKTYVKIGLLWVAATLIFEFTFGFASGLPLSSMLQAYNPLTGNLWLLIVIFIGFTPWLTAKARKII